MNHIYLLTGGNLGDREEHLRMAAEAVSMRAGRILAASALYRTAAWGLQDQPDFLNQALRISSALAPLELLDELQRIEQEIGRIRMERYGPRVIDLDILLYGACIIDEPKLQIPHPRLAGRRFALLPLAEIAPDLVHPVTQQTMKQMLMECADPLAVEPYA